MIEVVVLGIWDSEECFGQSQFAFGERTGHSSFSNGTWIHGVALRCRTPDGRLVLGLLCCLIFANGGWVPRGFRVG